MSKPENTENRRPSASEKQRKHWTSNPNIRLEQSAEALGVRFQFRERRPAVARPAAESALTVVID